MTTPSPAPGWYPDPSNPGNQIYWNGTAWSVPADADNSANISKTTAVAVGVCVLVAIGLVMSMQSVSLLTGSGPIWTGVAVVAAGTAVAFFMRAVKWVRILAVVCLALSLVNAGYMEYQMNEKRNELTHMFDR